MSLLTPCRELRRIIASVKKPGQRVSQWAMTATREIRPGFDNVEAPQTLVTGCGAGNNSLIITKLKMSLHLCSSRGVVKVKHEVAQLRR